MADYLVAEHHRVDIEVDAAIEVRRQREHRGQRLVHSRRRSRERRQPGIDIEPIGVEREIETARRLEPGLELALGDGIAEADLELFRADLGFQYRDPRLDVDAVAPRQARADGLAEQRGDQIDHRADAFALDRQFAVDLRPWRGELSAAGKRRRRTGKIGARAKHHAFVGHHLADRDIELDRHPATDERAARAIGTRQGLRRQHQVDVLDPLLAAARAIAIQHAAFLDGDPIDADRKRAAQQPLGRRQGRAAEAGDILVERRGLPTAAAVGEAFEIELGRDQGHALDLHRAGEQRKQSDLDVEGAQLHQIALGRRLGAGDPHQRRRQGRRRQHGKPDRPIDRDRAPGHRLELADDVRFEAIPIDKTRGDQNRAEPEHQERQQTVDQRSQHAVLSDKKVPSFSQDVPTRLRPTP